MIQHHMTLALSVAIFNGDDRVPISDSSNSVANQLHILYFNACSLVAKLDHLCVLCAARMPDIVCITETWLDNSITEYHLFNLDTYMNFLLFVQLVAIYVLLFPPYNNHLWNNVPDSVHSSSLGIPSNTTYNSIFVFNMYASISCMLFHGFLAFVHILHKKEFLPFLCICACCIYVVNN